MRDKDDLAQDMFLIAAPGPIARWLVHLYAQLNERQVEAVLVTRDTTDSDLLQRRELSNGTVRFVDGPVVHAAIEGKILLIDGMERAERNVMVTCISFFSGCRRDDVTTTITNTNTSRC